MTFAELYESRPYLRAVFEGFEREGIVFVDSLETEARSKYRLANNRRGKHTTGDVRVLVGRDSSQEAVQLPVDLFPSEQGIRASKLLEGVEGPFDFVAVLHANDYPSWDVIVLEA